MRPLNKLPFIMDNGDYYPGFNLSFGHFRIGLDYCYIHRSQYALAMVIWRNLYVK